MILHERLFGEPRELHKKLMDEGELPSRQQLAQYYAAFRERFGIDRLQSLDGEMLLNTIHDFSSPDSLGYWLEYKNDDELPAIFGSVAGGSALKYGIYRRKETGAWMTGPPGNQREVSIEDAIQIARQQRDQLTRGVGLLDELPANGTDEDYRRLEKEMNRVAPDVSNKAWGHKYFHMLYPDKLDDYHVEEYQRFHLIKLLQVPPEGQGRYAAAGRYVAIAEELGIPLNHLTTILSRRNGRPHSYWRIGTPLGGTDSRWEVMRNANCVAIGWPDLGDLSHIRHDADSKELIRVAMAEHYPNTPQVIGRNRQKVFNFVTRVSEGDLVLPAQGSRILGIGRVVGGYVYEPSSDVPHRRPVEWLSLEEWKMPSVEGLPTIVYLMRNHLNLIEVERRLLDAPSPEPGDGRERLGGIPGRIQAILERKKQVILYGPPGTGKTYWALGAAMDLASYSCFRRPINQLTEDERQAILGGDELEGSLVRMCTFHPAYGYEEFLEGYRPSQQDGQLSFDLKDGIFKLLCHDAMRRPGENFYLIIDEINRGDIPRIFGELLTVLEKDKRGQPIILPLSRQPFRVPDNVYVIGTMNTADRSIALLDTALRRRFGFIELMPDYSVLGDIVVGNSVPLGPWLQALNGRILEHIGRDARNLQVGHAYLLEDGQPVRDFARFARIVQDDILPLLEEYCYEDYSALERILGTGLVDAQRQRVRHELFSAERRDELVQALLSPSPEISTAPQVVASEAEQVDEEDEESELDSDDNG